MDPACSKKKKFTWATPKMKKIYIQKYIYQFKSFQKHFILSKYQMFWLSCDFFFFHSVWRFLLKKGSLSANAAVKSKLYKACLCNVVRKTPDNIAQEKLYAMLSRRLQTTWHTKKSRQCCLNNIWYFRLNILYIRSFTSKKLPLSYWLTC